MTNGIFLDFDGVINSSPWFASLPSKKGIISDFGSELMWIEMVDPEAIKKLNKIIEKTRAKVIISSSWRCHHTIKRLQSVLNARGFIGEIIGKTPCVVDMNILNASEPSVNNEKYIGERGLEIKQWLVENAVLGIDNFIILDDNSDMADLRKFLIKTSWHTGLLDEHVDAAISMLCPSS